MHLCCTTKASVTCWGGIVAQPLQARAPAVSSPLRTAAWLATVRHNDCSLETVVRTCRRAVWGWEWSSVNLASAEKDGDWAAKHIAHRGGA
eukprot:15458845-Alexandrium_andersonii.AAC.1